MKPTKAELKYWDRLANEVGCIVCRTYLGKFNDYVSIHHIDGRTKKDCHMNVIPLCENHHGRNAKPHGRHFMARSKWEELFGTEAELKAICDKLLEDL